MAQVQITDLPTPSEMRGGWSALAAVQAAHGWDKFVYATEKEWFYHDGCGNWCCLRFHSKNKAVLVGHDHEWSSTYFRESAEYFDKEETNLLEDAPSWWGKYAYPSPFGRWIGFIYGWNGSTWHSADYEIDDGFEQLGLLNAISADTYGGNSLSQTIEDFFEEADQEDIDRLVSADGNITSTILKAVIPTNTNAGIKAAKLFLKAKL